MATTTYVGAGVQMIALDRIRHDSNVRDVAGEDVAALAGSIALLVWRRGRRGLQRHDPACGPDRGELLGRHQRRS